MTPDKLEQSLERALTQAPEPAKYADDAAVIARVLKRWYGDEAAAVLRVALEMVMVMVLLAGCTITVEPTITADAGEPDTATCDGSPALTTCWDLMVANDWGNANCDTGGGFCGTHGVRTVDCYRCCEIREWTPDAGRDS